MARIQLKGFEVLSREEFYQLNKIVNSYYEKIKRSVNQDFTVSIKLKEYKRQGKKDKAHKFSIQLGISIPTKRKIESSAADWDLNRTLHSGFKKILEEIEHMFRVSNQKE